MGPAECRPVSARRPVARPPLLPITSLPPPKPPAPDQDLSPWASRWATVLSLLWAVQPQGGRALPDPTAPLQRPPCPSQCGHPVCCCRPCPRPDLCPSPQGVPLQLGEGPLNTREQMGNKRSHPFPSGGAQAPTHGPAPARRKPRVLGAHLPLRVLAGGLRLGHQRLQCQGLLLAWLLGAPGLQPHQLPALSLVLCLQRRHLDVEGPL